MAVGFRAPLPLGLSKPHNADVGYRGLLAFWCGGATSVSPTGAAGVHSLLAPWLGGAGVPQTGTTGYRSLLAHWLGGAGVPQTGTTGYRSLLAHWLGGAGVGAFSPTPEPPAQVSPGYNEEPRRRRITQRATIYPFEEPDQYRTLHARARYDATLKAYVEPDQYGSAAANAIWRGQMVASTHADEYAQLLARRGLPSQQTLHLLFNEIHFELCGAIMRKGKS